MLFAHVAGDLIEFILIVLVCKLARYNLKKGQGLCVLLVKRVTLKSSTEDNLSESIFCDHSLELSQ